MGGAGHDTDGNSTINTSASQTSTFRPSNPPSWVASHPNRRRPPAWVRSGVSTFQQHRPGARLGAKCTSRGSNPRQGGREPQAGRALTRYRLDFPRDRHPVSCRLVPPGTP